MKLGPPFTPSTDASPAGFRGTASGLGPRPAQRQGVALVVTLILLALITTMAIGMIIGRFQDEFVAMLTMLKHSIQLLH